MKIYNFVAGANFYSPVCVQSIRRVYSVRGIYFHLRQHLCRSTSFPSLCLVLLVRSLPFSGLPFILGPSIFLLLIHSVTFHRHPLSYPLIFCSSVSFLNLPSSSFILCFSHTFLNDPSWFFVLPSHSFTISLHPLFFPGTFFLWLVLLIRSLPFRALPFILSIFILHYLSFFVLPNQSLFFPVLIGLWDLNLDHLLMSSELNHEANANWISHLKWNLLGPFGTFLGPFRIKLGTPSVRGERLKH